MRNYLFGLFAALLIPVIPGIALADRDHDHDHDHDRGRGWDHHDHGHGKPWHYKRRTYRDNYYMEFPAEPVVIVQPRPVVVQPRPVAVPYYPPYQSGPSLNINIH